MGVTKFNGVLDLDLKLKCEMKEFENEDKQKIPYVSYFVEVPGIGGSVERISLGPIGVKKEVGKYVLEAYINKAVDSKAKADEFFGTNKK